MQTIQLLEPSLDWLPAYADALRTGWSANTRRDVSGEKLASVAANPAAALRLIMRTDAGQVLPDNTVQPWLPGRVLWIVDGAFCGTINLRHQPGTEALPPSVSGHLGYAIVPWKRRRGYATQALRQLLPIAARLTALPRLSATCDSGNLASKAVIEANGGVLDPETAHSETLTYWIPLPPAQANT